jgi:hypothetical protein
MRMVVGLLVLALGGCANWGKQLYVAHDTKLGIDASINTATSSGSIDLGYDRRFLTYVPRSVDAEGGDADAREVMSVIACSNLRVGIISIDYYDESLATGRAAVRFAEALARKRGETPDDYFACFTKEEEDMGGGQ